jgi:hypothetical protein
LDGASASASRSRRRELSWIIEQAKSIVAVIVKMMMMMMTKSAQFPMNERLDRSVMTTEMVVIRTVVVHAVVDQEVCVLIKYMKQLFLCIWGTW